MRYCSQAKSRWPGGPSSAVVLLVALMSTGAAADDARTLHVGKGLEYESVAAAAASARDGDTVEIQAGDYWRDVAVWKQKKLTIRGARGRVRLLAGGASAQGKAIWVMQQGDFTVENIQFIGAAVADKNGAGIRFEKGRLVVRNCLFADNENGILAGNDRSSELQVIDSEFVRNGAGDGLSHNLYVGTIDRLLVTGSRSSLARSGHLIKTRARNNLILYNRLTDDIGGTASYELEFPSGGMAYVMGNIIQQGAQTENMHIVSYGTEGYEWPKNELYMVNNTLVDDRAKNGVFLRVMPGAQKVVAVNNLLLGSGGLGTDDSKDGGGDWWASLKRLAKGKVANASGVPGAATYANNPHAEWSDVTLAQRQDYRLRGGSRLVGTAIPLGTAGEMSLVPEREYVLPVGTKALAPGIRLSPGALQTTGP